MKNVTIAVPEDVYRKARVRAAERGTSISGMVAEYLVSIASDAGYSSLEEQQRRIQREIKRFRASDRLPREELHERALR